MQPNVNFATDTWSAGTLEIRPWPDDVIDRLGFDPRSAYVETYWLGILGPSTTWLVRRMVAGLDEAPDGYPLALSDTARSLGLSDRGGRHSPFVRAIARTIQFELARPMAPIAPTASAGLAIGTTIGTAGLAVRRKLPPLSQRQLERLPAGLQRAHADWQEQLLELPLGDQQRRRGCLLALSMLELGEDLESAERHLLRWHYHPAMAQEAARWAWERHRAALMAAG